MNGADRRWMILAGCCDTLGESAVIEQNRNHDGMSEIVIRGADDAWHWFERAVSGADIPENCHLRFEGWPDFSIVLSGKDWHGTVPSRVMGPLMEVQKDLHRQYAAVVYGSDNLRRLKDEDRDKLEIVVKVKEGSSDYSAPLADQLNSLAEQAIAKMTSKDLMITILGLALTWGGVEISKSLIASKQTQAQADVTVKLSQQETERLKVFADAVRQAPVLNNAQQDLAESQNRLLKSLKPGDKAALPGVKLDSGEAKEITTPERARSEYQMLKGAFRVLVVDASKGNDFRVKLARIEDGLTFTATVPFELDSNMKTLIQRSEWSMGKLAISMMVEAKVLREAVSDAKVIHVEALP